MDKLTHWNYRVIHEIAKGEDSYRIVEVHYEGERIAGYNLGPTYPEGETLEDLLADLAHYQEAATKPVLEMADIRTVDA